MAVISQLDIFLRGNTGNLDSALDRSNSKLSAFKSQVGGHGASISSVFGKMGSSAGGALNSLIGRIPVVGHALEGLVGSAGSATSSLGLLATGFAGVTVAIGAAVAALVGFGLHQQGVIEANNRTAQSFGLSYNQFVALQHAADQSGISVEELSGAMRHLQEAGEKGIPALNLKTSIKAPDTTPIKIALDKLHGPDLKTRLHGPDTKPVKDALDKLHGPDLSVSFKDASITEKFALLADKIKGTTSQSERLKISMEIFPRELGPKMLAMLQGGSEAQKKWGDEAKALGLFLSQDQVEANNKAIAAWKRMGDAMTGIGNTMAVALAPAVTKITGIIQWLFQGINTGIQGAMPYLQAIYDTTIAYYQMLWEIAQPAVQAIEAVMSEWGKQLSGMGVTFGSVKEFVLDFLFASEYGFKHWKDVLALGWDSTKMAFSLFVSGISYAFTDTLPAVFEGFGLYSYKFFRNLTLNVTENWKQLWDYINSGGEQGGHFVWHALDEGWQDMLNKIKSKSSVPLNDFQRQLAGKIKAEESNLGGGLIDFIHKKMAALNLIPSDDEVKGGSTVQPPSNKGTEAAMAGSAEAFKIIAGQGQDKLVALGNQTVKVLMDHLKELKELNKGKGLALGKAKF